MQNDLSDITIIGAGPTGLFGAFYAGMRGASCRIIDALPAVGGQLMALYPEKFIFDVAGFQQVLARDFVKGMADQAFQFGCDVRLDEIVTGLRREGDEGPSGHFVLETTKGDYPTRTIIIAAGIGAFEPRKLPAPGLEGWEEKGLFYKVLDPKRFAGQRVLIVGGGDSAFDWVLHLENIAASIMLIHRRDGFRAHMASIRQAERMQRQGKCEIRTFWEVKAIEGRAVAERVTLQNTKTSVEETFPIDAVIPQLGFHSDLGAIRDWGLETEKADIKVDRVMLTNIPGIYAAGDITTYEGKLKLIATGVAEACTAVNHAVHWLDPKRKMNPGHSSDLKIFATQQHG